MPLWSRSINCYKEKRRNISLPTSYKVFFQRCQRSRPEDLVGTDLINDIEDLNGAADELLRECGMDAFLKPDDFVFMMHQGCMFWYFSANGDPDPIFFGYLEGKESRDHHGHLSTFLLGLVLKPTRE